VVDTAAGIGQYAPVGIYVFIFFCALLVVPLLTLALRPQTAMQGFMMSLLGLVLVFFVPLAVADFLNRDGYGIWPTVVAVLALMALVWTGRMARRTRLRDA